MKLRRFYGPTVPDAALQVREALGAEALIIETRAIEPGSPEQANHPGARFEIAAAVQTPGASAKVSLGRIGHPAEIRAGAVSEGAAEACAAKPRGADLVEPREAGAAASTPAPPLRVIDDLARLKQQVHDLLHEATAGPIDIRDQTDLVEYRNLLDRGIDHSILRGSFRRWLAWRTGAQADPRQPVILPDADLVMESPAFSEWLWREWTIQLDRHAAPAEERTPGSPEILGLVGSTGVGKSTLLAKLASRIRLSGKKSVAILTLDAPRPGAAEPWRALSRLMDISALELINPADTSDCLNLMDRFDWVGVDTPGAMDPASNAGRLYGALLAQCPQMRTVHVLDIQKRDRASRDTIKKMRPFRPSSLTFSKLDETRVRGAMVNLTFDGEWPIESISSGPRVPEDLDEPSARNLRRWVFESTPEAGAPAAAHGAIH